MTNNLDSKKFYIKMDQLPGELMRILGLQLDYTSLMKLCTTSPLFNKLCNDDYFLREKISQLQSVPGLVNMSTAELKSVYILLGKEGKVYSKIGYPPEFADYSIYIPDPIIDISGSTGHRAAVSNKGDIYIWGDNSCGRLGLGLDPNTYVKFPTKIPNLPKIVNVECGAYNTIFLTDKGEVYVCGSNIFGQLGFGDTVSRWIPSKIKGIPRMKKICCKEGHVAALAVTGQIYVWGTNFYGELGLGDTVHRSRPTPIPGFDNVINISLGEMRTTWVTNEGKAYIANHFTVKSLYPVLIDGPSNIRKIACGSNHLAVITAEGEVYSMGKNWRGQLGLSHNRDENELTKIPNLSKIINIFCGFDNTGAISQEGKLYVFGLVDPDDKYISKHYNRINKIVLTTKITEFIFVE